MRRTMAAATLLGNLLHPGHLFVFVETHCEPQAPAAGQLGAAPAGRAHTRAAPRRPIEAAHPPDARGESGVST